MSISSTRRFCVGASTAYSIMTQLDRLMVATKEIVGEQYHIHGIGFASLGIRTDMDGGEIGQRTNVQFRLPQVV